MAHRGRGLLEVKASSNPFFQSTAADIGVNPYHKIEWSGDHDPAMLKASDVSRDTFSFLYARESDTIGSKVAQPQIERPMMLTKTEFLKKRREELRARMTVDEAEMQNAVPPRVTVEDILAHYKHEPKAEDPRYLTTSNEIGKKIPTAATFVAERAARKQDFSKSFNSKPKNSSMNTSITKSTVHPKLDPQFL